MPDYAAALEEGLALTTEGERRVIPWDNIVSVVAYKRDLYTYDSICLDVYVSVASGRVADETRFTLTEDLDGWKPAVDAMPSHLRGMLAFEEWFFEVAFPAFESCTTRIYQRTPHTAVESR